MEEKCLVLDIGGGSLKLGFSSDNHPHCLDNCIYKSKKASNKTFIGNEIDNCKNLSSLFGSFPFKKGYLSNWDIQKQILDSVLEHFFYSKSIVLSDLNLVVTEPYFNFLSTKETMNEIFFEDYQVAGLIRSNPAFLAAYKYQSESAHRLSRYCVVVDSGYSFTHLIPIASGLIMKDFVLRLSVGGKILTNRLIEMTSYRQLDVRSEVYIMNQCKEDSCFVSLDFWNDLDRVKSRDHTTNTIAREYVLPDYVDVQRGYLQQPLSIGDEQISKNDRAKMQGYTLHLANERFTVPELLFHPGDIGYQEMGLVEAMDCLISERLPSAVRPGAWANCLLIGGNACLPGFSQRLMQELRSSAPTDLPVNVVTPPNPRTYAWEGGALLASTPGDFDRYLVTRKEYEENGHAYCESKFPVM